MTKSTTFTPGDCCPIFHPEKWNHKTFEWKDKLFIRETMPTIFHLPFPPIIAKKVTRMMKRAEQAQALLENDEDILLLFTDPHPFKSEMYLSVTGKVPKAINRKFTGTFKSKVFEGNYNKIPKFIKQMNALLKDQGMTSKKYFIHYAYCPKCAKEAGCNYIVLFAEIE